MRMPPSSTVGSFGTPQTSLMYENANKKRQLRNNYRIYQRRQQLQTLQPQQIQPIQSELVHDPYDMDAVSQLPLRSENVRQKAVQPKPESNAGRDTQRDIQSQTNDEQSLAATGQSDSTDVSAAITGAATPDTDTGDVITDPSVESLAVDQPTIDTDQFTPVEVPNDL